VRAERDSSTFLESLRQPALNGGKHRCAERLEDAEALAAQQPMRGADGETLRVSLDDAEALVAKRPTRS
jgi:hypothetical protein